MSQSQPWSFSVTLISSHHPNVSQKLVTSSSSCSSSLGSAFNVIFLEPIRFMWAGKLSQRFSKLNFHDIIRNIFLTVMNCYITVKVFTSLTWRWGSPFPVMLPDSLKSTLIGTDWFKALQDWFELKSHASCILWFIYPSLQCRMLCFYWYANFSSSPKLLCIISKFFWISKINFLLRFFFFNIFKLHEQTGSKCISIHLKLVDGNQFALCTRPHTVFRRGFD